MKACLRVGVTLVFVVAMAGCESEPESGASPAAQPWAAGSLDGGYSLAVSGGELTVSIPGEDEGWKKRIRAVASRVSAAEPKSFAEIWASNTGVGTLYVCGLSVVDGAGKRITFQFALDYVNGILRASEGLDPDVYNEIAEQWNLGPDPAPVPDADNEMVERQGYDGRNPAEVPPGYTATPGMVATEQLEGVTGVYSGLKTEDELLTPRCDDALQPGRVG
jgi:hypothetical protein